MPKERKQDWLRSPELQAKMAALVVFEDDQDEDELAGVLALLREARAGRPEALDEAIVLVQHLLSRGPAADPV